MNFNSNGESLKEESRRQKLAKRSAREAQIVRARNLGCDRVRNGNLVTAQWTDDTSSYAKLTIPHSYLNADSYTMADFISEISTSKKRIVRRTSLASRILHENSTVHEEIKDKYNNLSFASKLEDNVKTKLVIDAIRTGRDPLQNLLKYCYYNSLRISK